MVAPGFTVDQTGAFSSRRLVAALGTAQQSPE
jgi:hypothetical protein